MLSVSQINSLCENSEYKKTRGLRYNWKNSKAVCSSIKSSIYIDLSVNGVLYKNLGVLNKIIIFLIKRIIISKEIGAYRNDVVERALNSSISVDFDICSLITPNYIWISDSAQKISQLKTFSIKFVTDSKVQQMIYDILGYTELEVDKKKKCMEIVLGKVNMLFNRGIKLALRKVSINSRYEYNKFIEINSEYIVGKQMLNQVTGELTSVVSEECIDVE